MSPRVLIISPEVVFPTNAGGRAAVLAQCAAIRQAGFDVDLLVFHREPVLPEDARRHTALADRVMFVRRRSIAAGTIAAPLLPNQQSSRWLSRRTARTVERRLPRPHLIVAQQEWTVDAGTRLWLHRDRPVPVLLSSHNDEAEYYLDQFRAARGLRRQYLRLERVRLAPALKKAVAASAAVVTLSRLDERAYPGVDVRTIPHAIPRAHGPARQAPTGSTLLFVGALDMPHAVDGLLWFAEEVWPSVLNRVPAAVLEVVGRRVPPSLRQSLSSRPGIRVLGEVSDLGPYYEGASVFINPVFSGSGINIKLAAPIGIGIPSVTTTIGARGYEGLGDALLVADLAGTFADHCVDLLKRPGRATDVSQRLIDRAVGLQMPAVSTLWGEVLRGLL